MTMTTAQNEQLKILQSFCDAPNDSRSPLQEPFTIGHYSYASNGHIAVRVVALTEVPKREAVRVNPDLLPWPEESTRWQALPALPPADGECLTCMGHGRVVACDECGGEGEVSWSSALHTYSATCLECEGSGLLPANLLILPNSSKQTEQCCPDCAGTGSRWNNEELAIAGTPFSVLYLAKIAQLPDPAMAMANTAIPFLWFASSNGLRGVLAPRRSKPTSAAGA